MKNKSQLEIREPLRFLVKSSFIVSISLFLSKLISYIYRIVIARHYGPEAYGLFALSIMLIGWFRIFGGLGLKQGALRYISLFRGQNKTYNIQYIFKKSLIILIITGTLAGSLLFFFSEYLALNIFSNPNLIIFLKISSITIPLALLGEFLLSVIRSYEKIGWFSFISNILGNLGKLIILITLIFFGVNLISIPISYLTEVILIVLASYFVCKFTFFKFFNSNKVVSNNENKKTFKEMFSYSWPFMFYGVMTSIFYWIDSFMIGIFINAEELGIYHAAIPIALLLTFPLDIFRQLFFPLVTKEYSKGNINSVKELSKQVEKWVFVITTPFLILFVVFPGVFINLFFGSEYLLAENALRFLSIGVLFTSLFGISEDLLSIKGKSKLILLDILIGALLNIILNFILVPLYGISGAGFATMISLIILNLLFFIQSYKYFTINPFQNKIFKILIILILDTILLILIKSFIEVNLLYLVFLGILFFTIYVFFIFITKCLNENDIYILKLIFKRVKSL